MLSPIAQKLVKCEVFYKYRINLYKIVADLDRCYKMKVILIKTNIFIKDARNLINLGS